MGRVSAREGIRRPSLNSKAALHLIAFQIQLQLEEKPTRKQEYSPCVVAGAQKIWITTYDDRRDKLGLTGNEAMEYLSWMKSRARGGTYGEFLMETKEGLIVDPESPHTPITKKPQLGSVPELKTRILKLEKALMTIRSIAYAASAGEYKNAKDCPFRDQMATIAGEALL